MPHNAFRFAALTIAAVLAGPLSAPAQTLVPPPTPESHVLEAKRLLGDVAASPDTDTGKQIAGLQVDFTDFAAVYFSGGTPPARKETSGTAGAVGTSGTAAVDWRPKYAAVERDLTALIGSSDPKSPDRGVASLDPTVRTQLENVRKNLQLFYAAAMAQGGKDPASQPPPAPPSTAPSPSAGATADIDTGTIAALLDRMQTLVDQLSGKSTKDGAVGTSGSLSKSGKIEVDRQALDELQAELAQLRTMLSQKK